MFAFYRERPRENLGLKSWERESLIEAEGDRSSAAERSLIGKRRKECWVQQLVCLVQNVNDSSVCMCVFLCVYELEKIFSIGRRLKREMM